MILCNDIGALLHVISLVDCPSIQILLLQGVFRCLDRTTTIANSSLPGLHLITFDHGCGTTRGRCKQDFLAGTHILSLL